MKHKAKLTISCPTYGDGSEKIEISVSDADAGIEFLELEIDLSDFAKCLTGLASVGCSMQFRGLDNVGKLKERKKFEFQLPENSNFRSKIAASEEIKRVCPSGWSYQDYFSSQNSFFEKDGRQWARTNIFRWHDKPILTDKEE